MWKGAIGNFTWQQLGADLVAVFKILDIATGKSKIIWQGDLCHTMWGIALENVHAWFQQSLLYSDWNPLHWGQQGSLRDTGRNQQLTKKLIGQRMIGTSHPCQAWLVIKDIFQGDLHSVMPSATLLFGKKKKNYSLKNLEGAMGYQAVERIFTILITVEKLKLQECHGCGSVWKWWESFLI